MFVVRAGNGVDNQYPAFQLYLLHLIETRLRNDKLRAKLIFDLQERVWWLDYLDNSDYRQIYALKVLMNEDEDFEGDENVIASYDAACL